MKKLLLLLVLATTLLSSSQEQFKGAWECSESNYVTTVLADKEKVSKIFNFSITKNRFINEAILSQTKDTLKTKLINDRTGYAVNIKYYMKTNDTLVNAFSGDYNKKILLTRVKINN
tara:strand:- start:414 stop:764 length:351 start_codon:yes stop_codon:yes gene_type:complete